MNRRTHRSLGLAVPFTYRRLPLAVACAMGLASAPVLAANDAVRLGPQVIIGEEGSAVGPDTGYVARSSFAGTKTDTPLMEIPRSVSVVTGEQMRDRNVISISDALRYTAGIQAGYFGEDNKQDWFVIRGFKQANNGLYRDGNRVNSYGFYSWQVDPFMLERVEILKGAASVLYGQNPPGGAINLVSKRPTASSFGELGVQYGSFDRKQLSLDMGGPLDDEGRILYRVVALSRDTGTQTDDVDAERLLFAPSMTFNFSDDTALTMLASFQRDNSNPALQFLPAEGSLTRTANGRIDDDSAVGEPSYEKFDRTQYTLGYEFTHRFDDAWSFQQNLRYGHMDVELRQLYSAGYLNDLLPGADPSRRLLMRGMSNADGQADSISVDNRLVNQWRSERIENTFLAGIDYQKLEIDDEDYGADPLVLNPIDIYNPNYGGGITLIDYGLQPVTDADLQQTRTRADQIGGYLQNQFKLDDRWVLLVGGRYDKARSDIDNRTTGASKDIRDEEFTWNAGLAYLFGNGMTAYASYSEFFLPVAEINTVTGEAFKPESGDQKEVGLKYQPPGFDGYFNIAAFELTQENVRKNAGAGTQTQLGEVRSRGLELEAVANVTENLSVTGSMTFLDAETRKSTIAAEEGSTPSQVADRLASLWGTYNFRGGVLDGLAIGAGARYTGETYGDNTETMQVPSYTLYDAMLSYRFDDIKLQLNANNLTDKEYVATCDYYCWYGNRRNVIASVSYAW